MRATLKLRYLLAALGSLANGAWMFFSPASHWATDAPLVFLPALLMAVLTVPTLRRRAGEPT